MTSRNKQLTKFAIRICFTIVTLVWVFNQVDLHQFWQTLKMVRLEFLIAAWVLAIVSLLIRSVKMKLILRKQQCTVSIATLLGASAITSFYSMFMPGLLSTGAKWYILKKDTGKGSHVFSSMIYNQFTEVVTVVVFGLTAFAVVNPASILLPNIDDKQLLPVVCGISAITITIIVLLLLNRRTGDKAIRLLSYVLRYLPTWIRQKSEEILEQLVIFQTAGGGFHSIIVLITIVNSFVGGVVGYILSAKGANIAVPLGVFFWLPATIYILGRIPISIANLGVREVTLVGILTAYGVEASAALLMSMVLFSGAVLMAIIGAIYQFYWAINKKTNLPIE